MPRGAISSALETQAQLSVLSLFFCIISSNTLKSLGLYKKKAKALAPSSEILWPSIFSRCPLGIIWISWDAPSSYQSRRRNGFKSSCQAGTIGVAPALEIRCQELVALDPWGTVMPAPPEHNASFYSFLFPIYHKIQHLWSVKRQQECIALTLSSPTSRGYMKHSYYPWFLHSLRLSFL